MQTLSLPKNLYKFYAHSRTQQALDLYRNVYQSQVTLWRKLKTEGVSDALCQQAVGISRASFFRHQKILALRRQHPTYGKQKIAVILRRLQPISGSVPV